MWSPKTSIMQRDIKRLTLSSSNSSSCSSSLDGTIAKSIATYTWRRKQLGKFHEEIFQAKLARGERMFGQPITMIPYVKQCGLYAENTLVSDFKIVNFKDSHKFYFHRNVLTEDQKAMMLDVPTIKFRNNAQIYASNPYHATIGKLKLYFYNSAIQRCKVLDLYCSSSDGKLKLNAIIHLYDKPGEIIHVEYSHLFDYPQNIRHYQEIEPETKPARLYLGSQIPETFKDAEIEKFFEELIHNKTEHRFYNVKILDYKNKVYYVDLIGDNELSAVTLILRQFRETKLKQFLDWERPGTSKKPLQQCYPVPNRSFPTPQKFQVFDPKFKGKNYRGGALKYFKLLSNKLISSSNTDKNTSYTKKRFFEVMVMDWRDPDHLIIYPSASEYLQCFQDFVKAIQDLDCVKRADKERLRKLEPFQQGEHILFKNTSGDVELGKWLRGKVVSVSCYNEHSLVVSHLKQDMKSNYKIVSELIKKGMLDADDLIYLVRSVDYGFHCLSSQVNMRHLTDIREFRYLGTWGLRCRLFGVHPLRTAIQNENAKINRHSKLCNDVMDSWLRERILDRGRMSQYRVLFRTDFSFLQPWEAYDDIFDVTIFHRHEPTQTTLLPVPRLTRYDCLNWHLVNCGVAIDDYELAEGKTETTHIQLDHHVVNLLVAYDMI